jgi:formylglycine-generating enzyme required for sulfatase activity/tRNA A-37 threonylcarbamoyl transferase component Bud32
MIDTQAASFIDSALFLGGARLEPRDAVEAEATFEPGARFGAYRIVRPLGRGGQASVHLAYDERLQRQVAIKVVRVPLNDPAFVTRFKCEAHTAARLGHPGVCTVHEAGFLGGHPFIVMRYVEGRTLADHLAETRRAGAGPPGVAGPLRTLERVARAVHAAHEAGIVHRDLKPGNIMIGTDGEPVVLDFGLALDQTVDVTLTQRVLGTPPYMAPEQIDPGLGRADRRTDVYALGVTLYECLTLRRPFDDPSYEVLSGKILTQDPPDPRRANRAIDRDLRAVLRTALAKSPDWRYQTALDLAEDLAGVRSGRSIAARPSGPWGSAARWAWRHPGIAATLGGLLPVLVVGVVVTSVLLRVTSIMLERVQVEAELITVDELKRTADEDLWPILPATVPDYDRWLQRVKALAARMPVHEARRRELESRAIGREPWRFARPEDQVDHQRLSMLLHGLENLPSLAAEVRQRKQEAMRIRIRTIVEHYDSWTTTIEAIADERESPEYGGLRIMPQVGLVPLGRDPVSRLFEFAHLQTGDVPVRDVSGRLELTEESGIVFVLLPAGRFDMGAYAISADHPPGSPNADEQTCPETTPCPERPVCTIELDAFFIAKHEMTQGQWLRATRPTPVNPSRFKPGSDAHRPVTLMHPVESVSWEESIAVLGRFGLVLPTEAQWEYAARAGTTTPWWTGDDRFSLAGAANLADRSAARAGEDWPHIAEFPELDDGWVEHAPVGSYRPNPFGLHDVHGNVYEYVLDVYGSYELPPRPGDGLRVGSDDERRVKRGGGFYEGPRNARSARRYRCLPRDWTFSSGLRPARALTGTQWVAEAVP